MGGVRFSFFEYETVPPSLDRLYPPVGSCIRYIQHRETLLVEEVDRICEGLFDNPHLRMWIGYLADGHGPLLFFTRSEFLCTRARVFLFIRYSSFDILFISCS